MAATHKVRASVRVKRKLAGGTSAYALAADLIPKKGLKSVQSEDLRGLWQRRFLGAGRSDRGVPAPRSNGRAAHAN